MKVSSTSSKEYSYSTKAGAGIVRERITTTKTTTKSKPSPIRAVGSWGFRVGAITITIFSLLVGAPLAAQYPNRLNNFPNADPANQLYVPTWEYVDDLEFSQFGEGAIDNVYSTIRTVSVLANPLYIIITGDTNTVAGGYTYDMNKFLRPYVPFTGTSLVDAKAYWNTLSAGAKTYYADEIYAVMPGILQFWYWSASELDA